MNSKFQDTFISKSKEIHNNQYDYSNTVYVNSNTKVLIVCPIHGEFTQIASKHQRGQGCPKCNSKPRKDISVFILESNLTHNYKYDYSESVYVNNKTKLAICCHTHGVFYQSPIKHVSGQGCPLCCHTAVPSNVDFVSKCISVHGDKYMYNNVKYKNQKNKISVTCIKHGEFEILPSNFIKGHGCSKCFGNSNKNNYEIINQFIDVHGSRYDYSLTNYTNAKTDIIITCNRHGAFTQSPRVHLKGHGCPKCNLSKGETLVAKCLDQLQIVYETQKSFSDCIHKSKLKFDFYIPSKNILMEYDGIQHFKSIEIFGGDEALASNKIRDQIKTEYAVERGITLIRFKYDDTSEYIKNKIESILI